MTAEPLYRAGSLHPKPLTLVPQPTQAQPTESAGATIRPLHGPAGIADVLATATTEVLAMSTLAPESASFRYLGGHSVRRGVRFRALFPDSARTAPKLCRHLATLSLAGADVRTMPDVPMDAVVVDDRVVLLPAERSSGSVAALQLPSVVTTARQLFERLWPESVPLADRDLPDGLELTPREEETLRLLAAGATDEVVAAQLGVAVRTVRRTVATLMNRLGARSRFQAGVKAAGRGWLLGRAS
jgi:DNA-binding CsgD family transcriptional regulator